MRESSRFSGGPLRNGSLTNSVFDSDKQIADAAVRR
jgi:hypothetical protein